MDSGSSSIKFSIYNTGDGEPLKLHEGAVDGIGTDQDEFWIKDAEGKKLVDEFPSLPTRAAAFKLVSDESWYRKMGHGYRCRFCSSAA